MAVLRVFLDKAALKPKNPRKRRTAELWIAPSKRKIGSEGVCSAKTQRMQKFQKMQSAEMQKIRRRSLHGANAHSRVLPFSVNHGFA